MEAQGPAWKFWYPMPFWHALIIFFLTNLVTTILVVTLREGLGQTWIPIGSAGGVGGVIGVFITLNRAQKLRKEQAGESS